MLFSPDDKIITVLAAFLIISLKLYKFFIKFDFFITQELKKDNEKIKYYSKI